MAMRVIVINWCGLREVWFNSFFWLGSKVGERKFVGFRVRRDGVRVWM